MKLVFQLFLAVFAYVNLYGQSFDAVKPNDLKTPTTPGFVLLDKAPSSIEKPTTPRTFGISLLNLSEGGAIDVTPYWLYDHPNYTFDKHVSDPVHILQTLNLSLATVNTDTAFTYALGLRSQLIRIFPSAIRNELHEKKKKLQDLLIEYDDPTEAAPEIDKVTQEIAAILTGEAFRPLLVVELAGAISGTTPDNKFKSLSLGKSGIWLNARVTPYKCPVDFTCLARYTHIDAWITDSSFLDFGAAISYEKNRIDISGEYVVRNDIALGKQYKRLAVVVNYTITPNIVAVASLGKNFENIQDIIALFGVKFGISNEKVRIKT